MPNVTLWLVAAVAGLVALGAAGWKGYRLGGDSVRAEYAQRDIAAANEAAAALKATQEKYRAIEQEQAASLAKVSGDYQKRLTDAQAKTRIALDAIRSGAIRLRLNDTVAEASRDCPAETAPGAPRPDGSGKVRFLGDADSAFLVAQASRCDAIVLRLNGVQNVLEEERK